MFELVFEGEMVAGIAPETVKKNMQQLFKASPAQIDVMFSGQRVVLKNKLDKPTALKYQAVMKKHGAVCRIALMAKDTATASKPSAPSSPAPAPAPAPASAETPPEKTSASAQAAPTKPQSTPTKPQSTPTKPQSSTAGLSVVEPAPNKAKFGVTEPKPVADSSGRLPVAGEDVDNILAGKDVSIAPTGTTLGEPKEVEAPLFEHLDDIDVAPAGSDLSTEEKLPPPPAPDVSHLSVAPPGSDMGEKKRHLEGKVPDISHITLDESKK